MSAFGLAGGHQPFLARMLERVEGLANGCGKFLFDDRFVEKRSDPEFGGLLAGDVGIITRAEDDGDIGTDLQYGHGKFITRQFRHGQYTGKNVPCHGKYDTEFSPFT